MRNRPMPGETLRIWRHAAKARLEIIELTKKHGELPSASISELQSATETILELLDEIDRLNAAFVPRPIPHDKRERLHKLATECFQTTGDPTAELAWGVLALLGADEAFADPVTTWEIAALHGHDSVCPKLAGGACLCDHPRRAPAARASLDVFRDLFRASSTGELLNNPPPGAPEWLRALLLDWIAGCTPDTTSQEIACNNCKTTMASASLTGRLEGAARLTTEETERMLRLFRRP